jgi:ADP-ribosylglycohydrolase
MVSDFRLRITWSQPEDLLGHFLAQATFEGVDVKAERGEWIAAGGSDIPLLAGASQVVPSHEMRDLARSLAARVEEKVQGNPELNYEEFLSLLPDSKPSVMPSIDTFHGAWLGRAAGCLLGKPVEKVQREGIRTILQSSGRWPLTEYFTAQGVPSEVLVKHPWNKQSAPNCLQENINGMAEDDDLNYPLIALLTLEKHGREFNTDHIADQWMKLLPAGKVFTAERIAYRNLLEAVTPLEAGGVNNPFKEWIGALIRTDVYGWVNPGNPKLAAQMAFRDAWLSHRRNGLYGASMSAAMCAVAMVSKDIDEVIDAGFAVLPPGSQILKACEFAREQGNSDIEYEEALDNLYDYVDGMHWVHTINNAASGVMALTRSRGDFSNAITLTVMGGWDTDSIGATVGSICGAMTGATGIDPKWSDPIDDRLASSIPGCDQLRLSELAIRTRALAV